MKFFSILIALSLLTSCGGTDQETEIRERIKSLQIITDSLEAAINSDYASCPASGDTSDALIRKICNVALAASAEVRVELKGQLAAYVVLFEGKLDAINDDLVNHKATLDNISASLAVMESDILTLQSQMTSANAAILALQDLTASITGVLAGNMITLDIGSENLAAGPLYETVLRRNDKKRFNGYVIALGTALSLPNAPVTATNGSATVVVAMTAHGYSVGDRIRLRDIAEGRGFSSGDLYGDFVVTASTANTFSVVLPRNATSNGTLGGNIGVAQKVTGEGMGTLWKSDDPSDVAVRVSNLGSKRYNFILRRIASDVSNDTAELCYSKTDNAATFATINAAPEGGDATIACK